MKRTMTLEQAIRGFELAFEARHLSSNTLRDYRTTFKKFVEHVGENKNFAEISRVDIREFLAEQEVSKKTVLNYHTGLSALWTWAVAEELVSRHVVREVERPKPEKRDIAPFSEGDIKLLLDGVKFSKEYISRGKRPARNERPDAERDRAILLLMLDTGVRATELCELKIHGLDMKNRRIKIFGKGAKERILPFSARTGQAIWKYLAGRKEDLASDPLFETRSGGPLDRNQLLKLCGRLGDRTGVMEVHPHRFRHTFAILFLRNGGDPWTLQKMLGHETMEMVKVYIQLAQSDLDASHRRASPVENLRL